MARPNADWLASLARQLGSEPNLDAVWQSVVRASIVQVDGAEHAGITLLTHKSVSTPAASDELVRAIDQHQYTVGQGPCLTAALEQQPVVHVQDLSTDTRWPEFADAAVSLGVRSMLSFQLYTDDSTGAETIGALNVYASPPAAFSDNSVHTGTLLAAHAAVAAAAVTKAGNLRVALDSRDVIGQAKGILMERYKLNAQQAFDLLITASQHTQRKVRDIAADLADTGELATDSPHT